MYGWDGWMDAPASWEGEAGFEADVCVGKVGCDFLRCGL